MSDEDFSPVEAAIRRALDAQGFLHHMGARVDEVGPGRVTLSLAQRPELMQQHGFFHGGVIAFLVDNAATAAAGTVIDRATQTCLTAEYKLNIVAPAKGDRLVCTATVVKPGRRLTVSEAKVHCHAGAERKLIAVALATIANVELGCAAHQAT
jgi:uncharacterized protein (TIGR00369 family)